MIVDISGNPTFGLLTANRIGFCLSAPEATGISCVGATSKFSVAGDMNPNATIALSDIMVKNLDTNEEYSFIGLGGDLTPYNITLANETIDVDGSPKFGFTLNNLIGSNQRWALKLLPLNQDQMTNVMVANNPAAFFDPEDGWYKSCISEAVFVDPTVTIARFEDWGLTWDGKQMVSMEGTAANVPTNRVELTITDNFGGSKSGTAVIYAGGGWDSQMDVTGFSGELHLVVTARGGNGATATANADLTLAGPGITISPNGIANNLSSISVYGDVTRIPSGEEVVVTFEDSLEATKVVNTTVNGTSYSVYTDLTGMSPPIQATAVSKGASATTPVPMVPTVVGPLGTEEFKFNYAGFVDAVGFDPEFDSTSVSATNKVPTNPMTVEYKDHLGGVVTITSKGVNTSGDYEFYQDDLSALATGDIQVKASVKGIDGLVSSATATYKRDKWRTVREDDLLGVWYINGRYVALGDDNYLRYSADGVLFRPFTGTQLLDNRSSGTEMSGPILLGNDLYRLYKRNSTTKTILYKTDISQSSYNWTAVSDTYPITDLPAGYMAMVTDGANTIVTRPDSNFVVSKDKGLTWQTVNYPTTFVGQEVLQYTNGKYWLVAADGNEISSSVDGLVWVSETTGTFEYSEYESGAGLTSSPIMLMGWANGFYYGIVYAYRWTGTGYIVRSPTLDNWVAVDGSVTREYRNYRSFTVGANNELYVHTANKIHTSTDGVTWKEIRLLGDYDSGYYANGKYWYMEGINQTYALSSLSAGNVITTRNLLMGTMDPVFRVRDGELYGFTGGATAITINKFDTVSKTWTVVGSLAQRWEKPLPVTLISSLGGIFKMGNKWIIPSEDARVLTTTDFVTFNRVATGLDINNPFDVYVRDNLAVLFGEEGIVITRDAGVTWEAGPSVTLTGGLRGGNILIGYNASGSDLKLQVSSDDGVTWTPVTLPMGSYKWSNVAYNGTKFYAIQNAGSNSKMYSSVDGITWTSENIVGNARYYKLGFGSDGTYSAVTNTDVIMNSTDGLVWVNGDHPVGYENDQRISFNGITFRYYAWKRVELWYHAEA